MKIFILLFISGLLSACISIPTSTPIHDGFVTLISEDVNLGVQTLYKNEKLNHYKINGVDAYCKVPSMDKSLYRCFSINGNQLTKGFNPNSSVWEELSLPVKIIQRNM